MEVKRYYFAGHAFPEPISGYGKQDGYVAWADHEALAALAGRMAEALKRQYAHKLANGSLCFCVVYEEEDGHEPRCEEARALLAEWDRRGKESGQ